MSIAASVVARNRLAIEQAEARVDVAGKNLKEAVDDTGTTITGPSLLDFVRRVLILHNHPRRIGRWRGWQLRQFRREETLTVLGPCAATGIETAVSSEVKRSAAREVADKNVCFARPQWRKDGRIFVSSALDHRCCSGEREEHDGGDPDEWSRSEIEPISGTSERLWVGNQHPGSGKRRSCSLPWSAPMCAVAASRL